MPSWYPEIDAPMQGDNSQRSLQKINNLLVGGSGATTGALKTWQATIWASHAVDFTALPNIQTRRAILHAKSTNNAGGVILRLGVVDIFTMAPGAVYTFEAPSGSPNYFNVNQIIAYGAGGITDELEVLTFQL